MAKDDPEVTGYIEKRQPCSQCPFRRNAIKGWLGPWTVGELLWALGREQFPCHTTITLAGAQCQELDVELTTDHPALKGCAGAAIFLNNKIERSRNHKTAAHQDALKDAPFAVRAGIFRNSVEFVEHHTLRPKPRKGRLK